MQYKIQNKETGMVIDDNLSLHDVEALLTQYEEEDAAQGIFTPNFYEIKPMRDID
jgi:hypothetical protein